MPDAIQQDVSQAGIPDLNDPNNTLSRAAGMDAMRARRRETVAAEMDEQGRAELEASRAAEPPAQSAKDEDDPDGDAVNPANGLQATHAEIVDEPASQLERQRAEDTVLAGDDLSRKVRMKVNGIEREVPLSEVIATAQKTEAGDAYLDKAKQTLAEVSTVAAEIRAAAKPNSTAASTETPSPTGQDDPLDKAIDSLFQGDEAQAKKLLREAISARSTAAPTSVAPEDVASQVEQRLVIRSAVRQFAKDYKDIAGNEKLRGIANGFIGDELKARGVNRLEELSPDVIPDVYEAAGRSTRNLLREAAGLPPIASHSPTPKVELSNERREAKRKIDEPSTAATRAQSSVAAARTTQDVMNEMRKARGQLVPPN